MTATVWCEHGFIVEDRFGLYTCPYCERSTMNETETKPTELPHPVDPLEPEPAEPLPDQPDEDEDDAESDQ